MIQVRKLETGMIYEEASPLPRPHPRYGLGKIRKLLLV